MGVKTFPIFSRNVYNHSENGISYFVCGHYATEVFGVKALAEDLKKEFSDKLEVKFIDVKNPI